MTRITVSLSPPSEENFEEILRNMNLIMQQLSLFTTFNIRRLTKEQYLHYTKINPKREKNNKPGQQRLKFH